MSNRQWEKGTITLPSANVAPLKARLREAQNDLHAKVRETALTLHALGQGTRSIRTYAERLNGFRGISTLVGPKGAFTCYRDMSQGGFRMTWHPLDAFDAWHARDTLDDTALHLAACIIPSLRGKDSIRKPTVSDVAKIVPKATSATKTFEAFRYSSCPAATITFDGREVTWEVEDNNHAVDYARESVMAQVFFSYLNQVSWTAKSGGVIIGNDENHRDNSDWAGGGGNYISLSYGPLGNSASSLY